MELQVAARRGMSRTPVKRAMTIQTGPEPDRMAGLTELLSEKVSFKELQVAARRVVSNGVQNPSKT